MALRALRAGEMLDAFPEDSRQVGSRIVSRTEVDDGSLLPLSLAAGRRMSTEAPAGTVLTRDMVELPDDSPLSRLRREQDALFPSGSMD